MVFLDVLERRKNKDSMILLDKIKELELYASTSILALCEAINIEQEFVHITNMFADRLSFDEIIRNRKWKKLSQEQRDDAIDKVRFLFKQYPIEALELDAEQWNIVFKVLRDINVNATDAIHVATALLDNSTLFITIDEQLKSEAKIYMNCMNPTEALRYLRDFKKPTIKT